MLLLANTQTFGRGLIAAALMGLGAGGEFDVAPYLIGRYFGLRSISTLYGLVWTAIATAGALGPMWLGRAYDRTGSYAWLVVTLSAITLAAALLLLTLPTPVRASNQGAL